MKLSKYNIIKKLDSGVLVYNSYSKASIILESMEDTEVFEDFSKYDKLDTDIKKMLCDNGFVIEDDRDELSELKYMFEKSYFEDSFLNIVLIPSLSCNFKCPYCFEKGHSCGKENIKKYFEVLKKFAEKNFKNNKFIQISLFGGEPLLFINEILEFLDFVKIDSENNGYKYITSIVTNGSLLNEKIVDSLVEHNLISLQITLDSDKETHDKLRIYNNGDPSFDILINKIKMLLDRTEGNDIFSFNMRINLSNCETDKFKETLLRFEDKYRSRINLLIRAVYQTSEYKEKNNNSVEELKAFYDISTDLGYRLVENTYTYQSCEGCGDTKFFYLMSDLTMWKCVNDLSFKEACVGKIEDNGEVTIMPNNNINWYNKASSCFEDPKCLDCKLLPDCLGGCILYQCKNCKKHCKTFDMASLPYVCNHE